MKLQVESMYDGKGVGEARALDKHNIPEVGKKKKEASKGTRTRYQRLREWNCPGSKGKRPFLMGDSFC